jgi:hypothetical protein
MYNFVFNHDEKFWTFLTIKDIHNQNQQHMLKGFNTCEFKNINTCCPSYEYILELVINLKTFDEGLSNKKHIQILESLKWPYQQVLCVWQMTLITYWNYSEFIGMKFHEHQNIIKNYG